MATPVDYRAIVGGLRFPGEAPAIGIGRQVVVNDTGEVGVVADRQENTKVVRYWVRMPDGSHRSLRTDAVSPLESGIGD